MEKAESTVIWHYNPQFIWLWRLHPFLVTHKPLNEQKVELAIEETPYNQNGISFDETLLMIIDFDPNVGISQSDDI